ncbi:MAG: CerR family C-terminal domain-containing protein [Planctomycetaceae bacterium]|nr:CerR family C-terminal domain-containing protein [Planctomycetaceae bacterium]
MSTRPDDEDSRTRLLNAAGEIFAVKGFQSATVREICSRAGANIAAINYHFGDKEKLYIEAVKQAHRLRKEQVPMPVWPEGTPPEARLRDFIETMVRRMAVREMAPWHHQLMMREMASPTRACLEMVEESIRPEHERLVALLRELLPPDVTRLQVDRTAFSIIGQCMFYKFGASVGRILLGDEPYARMAEPASIAEHIARFTLDAISCLRSTPRSPAATSGSPETEATAGNLPPAD